MTSEPRATRLAVHDGHESSLKETPLAGLRYREDMDQVRQRLTTWWNGGDIGRPVMQITALRSAPLEVD